MSITLAQLNEHLTTICGIFRQSAPAMAIQRVMLGQVGHLPEEFFQWACRRVADLEQLPRNLGNFLARDLWREWRAAYPEKVSREQRSCRDCSGKHDAPGYGFYAWAPDESGAWWRFFLPCRCMRLPAELKARPFTKAEALGQGWKLIPDDYDGTFLEFSFCLEQGRDLPAPGSLCGLAPGHARINPADFVGVDSQKRDLRRFRAMGEAERADALGW